MWCRRDRDEASDVLRSHFHDLCGERSSDTMSDKKRRPDLANQRYERGYNIRSRRFQELTSAGGTSHAWPVDDVSDPSVLGQVLRPSRLTIGTRGPTNSRVDAAMNKNCPRRR